jgi:hypothetical protein
VIPKATVTTPGDNIRSGWKMEAVGVGFNTTYSIAAELARKSSHFDQEVTVMAGQDHYTLYTITIKTGAGMMVVEGQRIIRNTAPGIIYSQNHWFRGAMFIPRPDRV